MPGLRTTWYFWHDSEYASTVSLCPLCSFRFTRFFPNLAEELGEPFLGIPNTRQLTTAPATAYLLVNCRLCDAEAIL